MADQTGSLTCPVCFEDYTATADPNDRRPIIICRNGHTLCSTCANGLDACPTCRQPKMVVPNRALLDVAERLRQNLTVNETGVPEISADHVKRAADPFAGGAYADVYDATWQNQSVALKVLRRHVVTANVLHDVLEEARLAMSLNHPNVVRVFGVVSINGGKGLVMEKADRGSLRSALDNIKSKLSFDQLVSVSIDIVDGLDFIHSKQMVHRDLKPENVLLFDIKSQLTAKIADFGTSKVVQSSLAGTAMIGTPYYMAPELFMAQVRYGWEVDVYSVSIVLYEVFSGRSIQDAYGSIVNPMQLLMCVASGKRPEIPESFPAELRKVVERGWSADANVRPKLADFREALCRLKPTTGNTNSTTSASTSRSGNANLVSNSGASRSADADVDVFAAFEAQLQELEHSTKAYKLVDARSQVEACRRLWMRLDDPRKATASTARFHSLKGYVHQWFGECSDAYKETYQALTELYELCLSGVSVEGEQVVTILRYAAEVCLPQDQFSAALVLVRYAVRYAKWKLSAAAYADALESLCCMSIYWSDWEYYELQPVFAHGFLDKIAEFVLSTRLKASANKPQINVATAHYHFAYQLWGVEIRPYFYSTFCNTHSAALEQLEKAQQMINQVDADNIWTAFCKRLKGYIINRYTSSQLRSGEKYEEAKQCLEDALGMAERILGKNNQTVARIYYRLALTLKKVKRFGEAENMYKKAIEAAENSLGPNCFLVGWTVECLANMYNDDLMSYGEAEKLYLRSIEIYKSVFGPGNFALHHLYDRLADTYTKLGQTEMAATYSRLAKEVGSGKLENKFKSIIVALYMLRNEVSSTLESGSEVSEAPGELVDVLKDFFKVASKPQPL